MFNQTKFRAFFIGTVILSSLTAVSVNAQTKLSQQSKVSITGIGPVRVGMTVAQASKAAGTRLVRSNPQLPGSCFYVKPQAGPQGLEFMVLNDRIIRVDINKGRFTTVSGAKIGDTEARIKSLYGGRLQVRNDYGSGHVMTFVPQAAADKNYRLVFNTDGNRVTRFRVGQLPQVDYEEGC
jgi:hypothetical protein